MNRRKFNEVMRCYRAVKEIGEPEVILGHLREVCLEAQRLRKELTEARTEIARLAALHPAEGEKLYEQWAGVIERRDAQIKAHQESIS